MEPHQMIETKKIMAKLQQGREDLKKKDGNTKDRVEGWRQNIQSLASNMNKQVGILKDLESAQSGGIGGGLGGADNRRDYFSLLVSRLQKDIEDQVRICQKVMVLNLKKNSGSTEENNQNWTLMRQQIRNETMKVIVQAQDPNFDRFQLIAKLLNMRDNLQHQIFYSSLYRKLVVYQDLNIHVGEYCPQKVVDCIKQINLFQETLGYKPTKLQFEELSVEYSGYFSYDTQREQCESTESLDSMIENVVDMENLIKKNFLMPREKIEQFYKNNPVQQTLRDEVEEISRKLEDSQKRLKDIMELHYNQNKDDSKAQQDTQALEQAQRKNQILEMQVEEKQKIIKTMENSQVTLKSQLRDSEEKYSKLANVYWPRLSATRDLLTTQVEELERIKQDAELLPSMFRAEALFRKQCKADKEKAVNDMQKYQKDHFKLISERDDLKNELDRKQRLAIQAIAARGNMKQHLDDEKLRNEEAQQRIKDLLDQLADAGKEVGKFKAKHDDMFNSVSSLNARIEELEQHKLHLLEKLKSYGDRGDLSYIVKTQKLGDIKTKEFKDRVQLEDYQPERDRDKRDKEYEQKQQQ